MKCERWSMESVKSVISHPAHACAPTGFAIHSTDFTDSGVCVWQDLRPRTSWTARTTRLGVFMADPEPNRQRRNVPDPPLETPVAEIADPKKRAFLIGRCAGAAARVRGDVMRLNAEPA